MNQTSPSSPLSTASSTATTSSFSQLLHSHCILRSYRLAYSASMDLWFCTLLFLIRQLQIVSLLVVPYTGDQNYDILEDVPNLKYVYQIAKIAVFQFNNSVISASVPTLQSVTAQVNANLYISIALSSIQLIMLALLLLPLPSSNKQINKIISKIITIGNIILVIPTIVFMTKLLVIFYKNSKNTNTINYYTNLMSLFYISLALSVFAFIFMVINYVLYINYHFAFSLKQVTKNILVRFPSSIHRQLGWLIMALIYRFTILFSYPSLFIAYLVLFLTISLYQAKRYAVNFQYFDARICRNLGMMNLFNVTLSIAMLSYYFGINLFITSLTSFIIAFYLFFISFFLTFRKFWIKRIIIDDNTTTEVSQITYVSTFIIFQTDRSDKKNQTYLSSLLKNHCNNCQQTDCCCKNRNILFDPSTQQRGNTSLQPHLDLVFVKHFYLKMIQDSIIQFPKSINLKMMICLYYLEFISLSTQVIKNIKYFNRKMVMDKLGIQQKFALYCMEQQFFKFVQDNNLSKGDKKIQNLKQFDEYFNTLVQKIITVSQNLKYFWSTMQTSNQQFQKQKKQINAQFLSLFSTKTLQLMTQIQWIYKQMKQINPSSVELREIMFFYAKDIVNDMDLFIRIKEDLKMENFAHKKGNNIVNNGNKKSKNQDGKKVLNLYGHKTANFVISDINTIKWASNNAKLIFGYRLNSTLLKTAITSLMPQFFARTHDSNVKHFMQTGICTKMNNTKVIWCRKQNGSCFKAYIYIKIMVNYNVSASSSQKDIQFYTSIENIGHNYIICGMDGQVYGCDQGFKDLFRCPMKFIQNYRPNIQVFFPALFQQFFNYFYKDSGEASEKVIESECSGYIPGKITQYIENLAKQKQNFFQKNKKSRLINQLYGFFLEIKMQQLTMEIKGRYLTVTFQIEKINTMGRDLILLKINKIQHDTVERYFQQFQKSIKQMLVFKQKLNNKREDSQQFSTKFQKHLSSNPFQFCLNPKKLRRVSKNMQEPIVIDKPPVKNNQAALDIRRQRAINQKVYIKSERVKQNISKIKRLMYKQKIFSANTLKILTEIRSSAHIQQQDEDYNQEETENMKSTAHKNFDNFSQDQLLDEQNDQNTIQKFTQNPNGEHQGEQQAVSFQQSTTSSAAFISLSTKIKLLKQKLRQVKPTRLLILCTALFVVLVVTGLVVYSTEVIQKVKYQQANVQQKSQSFGTNRLMESLMNLKLLNNHKNVLASSASTNYIFNQSSLNSTTNSSSVFQPSISASQLNVLQSLYTIISLQQLLRNINNGNKMQIYSTRPNYNSEHLVTIDGSDITMEDFFMRQLVLLGQHSSIQNSSQIIKQMKVPEMTNLNIGLGQYGQVISKLYQINNQEQQGLPTPILLYLIPLIVIVQVFAFVNVYINSKKSQVISKLISELYPHERHKYAKLFSKVSQKMAIMLKLTNIMNQPISNNRNKRQSHHANIQKQLTQSKKQSKQSCQQLLIKKSVTLICTIFCLFYITILISYKVQQSIAVQIHSQRQYFHNFMIAKMKLSYQLLVLQDMFTNDASNALKMQEYAKNIDGIDPPAKILTDVYNSNMFSQDVKQDILHFATKDMCSQLNPNVIFNVNEFQFINMPSYDYLDKVQDICHNALNQTFKRGVLQSYSYLSQSIQYFSKTITSLYPIQNMTNLLQSSLISTLLSISLCQQFRDQQLTKDTLLLYVKVGMLLLYAIISIVMLILWKLLYTNIAYMASMHNCYLLMVPFDLLNQNPYLRQFLKEQLQFKYNIY